eukprot:4424459-Prymnesium_polylepis.1
MCHTNAMRWRPRRAGAMQMLLMCYTNAMRWRPRHAGAIWPARRARAAARLFPVFAISPAVARPGKDECDV